MDNALFDQHFVGKDGFIWWIGQIATDTWKENYVGSSQENVPVADQTGYGFRYQVRIMGYHTEDGNALKDEELPWATVMLPVTAGGGGGQAWGTPNLRKGHFVYGFFFDGEDAQNPVIMGVLGYNRDTTIHAGVTLPFRPKTFWTKEKESSSLPTTTTRVKKEELKGTQTNEGVEQDPNKGKDLTSEQNMSADGSGSSFTADKETQDGDSKEKEPLANPEHCKEYLSNKSVQIELQNCIDKNQRGQKALERAKGVVVNPAQAQSGTLTVEKFKDTNKQNATDAIANHMERISQYQQKLTKDAVIKKFQSKYEDIPPGKVLGANQELHNSLDELDCIFRELRKNLSKMVGSALDSMLDRYVNVPPCAAGNVTAAILGRMFGFINSAMDKIMKPLEALMGLQDLAGTIGGGGGSMLGGGGIGQLGGDLGGRISEVTELVNIIVECNQPPCCPGSDVQTMSGGAVSASGTGSSPMGILDIISKAVDFADKISEAIDPDNFNFDVDFGDDLYGDMTSDCDTGPQDCGPPRAVFWGGSGSGAEGNAIISESGEILGVDVTNAGSGYEEVPPNLSFIDDCGNGVGGDGTVVVGPVCLEDGVYVPCDDGPDTGVTGTTIGNPGGGYIPVPDGSQGGDGRTWAEPDQTTVLRGDDGPNPPKTWDIPYDPGVVIPVFEGDTIRTPVGSVAEILASDGSTTSLPGGVSFAVPIDGKVTAPTTSATAPTPGNYPMENLKYPVILHMCDVIITNPGFGYEDGDKVVIEPDYGAEIAATFGPGGYLKSVKVVKGGEGFQTVPRIYIDSISGWNAGITPRFCIDRVTDELKLPEVQDKIVSVIDCVGKG